MMRFLPLSNLSQRISRRWFATGTVKFYNRKKAYGFIVGDDIEGDIFVHKRMLVGEPSGNAYLPFLLENERVSFDVVIADDGKQMASNVVFEDGSQIPMYREKHVQNVMRAAKQYMGMAVYDILDDDKMDEGTKVTKVMEEFGKAKKTIDIVKEKAQREAANRARGAVQEELDTVEAEELQEEMGSSKEE
jgi:cold shock CspA family protein